MQMRIAARWLGLLLLATLGADKPAAPTSTTGAPAAPPASVDPAVWQEPHELPPITSDMKPAAYEKALAAAVKRVDMDAMKRPDDPLPAPTGIIEVDTPWKPQTAYWHSAHRNPKWDSQMFVACSEFDADPRLAQAALANAAHLGYRDWLLPALAARIAYTRWQWDQAMAFGSFALADAPPDRKPVIARWMYSAAKADYKFEEALRLSAAFPLTDKDERDRLREALQAYQSLHAKPRPEPLAALAALTLKDLREHNVIHVKGSVKSPSQTNKFKESGKMEIEAPPGRMQIFAFGPKAPDVDFTAHFRFHAQGGKGGRNERSLSFVLIDPADDGEEQCDVSLFSAGRVDIEASGPSIGTEEIPHPNWQKEGTVRIIALGPDVEVFIDGKRAYLGPLHDPASKRELAFMFRCSGVHAQITEVSWKKILNKPETAK